jgi:hypothetical protein
MSDNEDQQDNDRLQEMSGKPRQDKRLYAVGPYLGPHATESMPSEDSFRHRAERDTRFAQTAEMGLTKGRFKAGWAAARRPTTKDQDAAKKRLRDMEVEKRVERLKALFNAD